MIEVIEKSGSNVIGLRVDGKLLHADYQQFIPKLEALIEEHGSIRCYCEITSFAGIELKALWDELKFDVKHCKQIERCAIVGDPSWHQWMTKSGKVIFHKADIRYFHQGESDQAWAWLTETADCCCGSGCCGVADDA